MADEKGLYLEVSPGGGKWWRFKYRFEGREKRLSLGVYPDVPLKSARKRRDEQRSLLADGIDPGDNRKAKKAAGAEKKANTFEVVAREWLAPHLSKWSKSNASKTSRLFERDIFPWIGQRPIAELTAPELLRLLRRIEERGAVETAHRALSKCGQVFRYGVVTGRLKSDLTLHLRGALRSPNKGHFAAITEPRELGQILRMFDGYQGKLIVRSALRLAPLVFVRPGELRHAKWEEIDLDKAEWRYMVSKTQTEHIVPLAKQSIQILREIQPLTGKENYVFPSERGRDRAMSDNALLAAMRRMGIGKEEVSIHGFRATARTILDEVLGFRPDFIEHQLAHAVRDPNGRAYNRTAHLEQRKAMMQKWADYLDELKKGDQKNV